jgi:hypothetical protein
MRSLPWPQRAKSRSSRKRTSLSQHHTASHSITQNLGSFAQHHGHHRHGYPVAVVTREYEQLDKVVREALAKKLKAQQLQEQGRTRMLSVTAMRDELLLAGLISTVPAQIQLERVLSPRYQVPIAKARVPLRLEQLTSPRAHLRRPSSITDGGVQSVPMKVGLPAASGNSLTGERGLRRSDSFDDGSDSFLPSTSPLASPQESRRSLGDATPLDSPQLSKQGSNVALTRRLSKRGSSDLNHPVFPRLVIPVIPALNIEPMASPSSTARVESSENWGKMRDSHSDSPPTIPARLPFLDNS